MSRVSLTLDEIDAARRQRGRAALLYVTDRCPVGCAHCSVDARPLGGRITDWPRYERVLDLLCAEPALEVVGISGGEPFTERRGLTLAARRLTEAGKLIVPYTSGNWAAAPPPAGSWPREILRASACLILSTDAYHATRLPPQSFINAARTAAEEGTWIAVQVATPPREPDPSPTNLAAAEPTTVRPFPPPESREPEPGSANPTLPAPQTREPGTGSHGTTHPTPATGRTPAAAPPAHTSGSPAGIRQTPGPHGTAPATGRTPEPAPPARPARVARNASSRGPGVGREVEAAQALLRRAFGGGWESYAEVRAVPLLGYGRGAGVVGPVGVRAGGGLGRCDVAGTPVVRYDGGVSACCNEVVAAGGGPDGLRRHVDQPDVLARLARDPYLTVLGAHGASALTRLPEFQALAGAPAAGLCDLCWKLVRTGRTDSPAVRALALLPASGRAK
ncbi:hypothetical protein [Streptomyces sp. CA-111067]|uniref:hypothetical protein n=1 Tax=Streptomyces sp. CA-111067 TaxID=3240046 RepID=UPI003D979F20